MPNRRQYNKRIKRLERLVYRNRHRHFKDDGTNTSYNSGTRDTNVDDATPAGRGADAQYSDAINYFIGTTIQTARQGYQTANHLTEFIVENVINFLWWMKLYRWFFIIEKTFIVLKLISDIHPRTKKTDKIFTVP